MLAFGMANRERRSGGWLLAVLGILALAVFNENVASLLEATGLNRLWSYTGAFGAAFLWVWSILASPVATHFYTFLAGILVAAVIRAAIEDSATASQGGASKPDMSLYELVEYVTTASVWAKGRGYISDRMVEHELLDAFSSGKLWAFARKYDVYGSTSPQYRIDESDFEHVRIDLDAVRSGKQDTIVTKPGYISDTTFHDWRVFKAQAERLWPKWVEPKEPSKKGLLERFRRQT